MPTPVSLSDVVAELEFVSEHTSVLINRQTGQMVTLTSDEMAAAEELSEEEIADRPGWEQEAITKVRQVLERLKDPAKPQ